MHIFHNSKLSNLILLEMLFFKNVKFKTTNDPTYLRYSFPFSRYLIPSRREEDPNGYLPKRHGHIIRNTKHTSY